MPDLHYYLHMLLNSDIDSLLQVLHLGPNEAEEKRVSFYLFQSVANQVVAEHQLSLPTPGVIGSAAVSWRGDGKYVAAMVGAAEGSREDSPLALKARKRITNGCLTFTLPVTTSACTLSFMSVMRTDRIQVNSPCS